MRICINGFGRIGRQALRAALDDPDIEVVRINDIVDTDTLAYLLKYDTAYGVLPRKIHAEDDAIVIDGQRYAVSSSRNPADLPHGADGTDVVIEATGIFRKREDAKKHLDGGAGKVLITAPAKDAVDGDFVFGVNEEAFDAEQHRIVTIGSCTTNCLAPMVKVLHDRFGIRHGLMTTVHAYTASQQLVDGPHKKKARGRAAAANIVPTTTGAAEMIGKIIPDLKGKLDGMALRVPVLCGSITDLTVHVQTTTDAQAVNEAFSVYAADRGRGVLQVANEELVSSDIVGNAHSCVIQHSQTQVMEGEMVKVLGWYDNEWAFSKRLVDMCRLMVGQATAAAS